jgi:4-amino-4-deoxy-L-arabinose transferase-like glycosyltransferase
MPTTYLRCLPPGYAAQPADSPLLQRPLLWLFVILSLHVAVWTFFGAATHGVIHHDMAEAWAWGQQFELGYSKHPPLFAWVTALWFKVFPREDWSFFLLSSFNGALGLAGAWMVAGRLLPRSSQWMALLLLLLTPFYSILALKFNANAILLSLWPWTAYVFIRSLETRSALYGVLFGLLAGLSILGKYYSVLLVASCFVSALLHPNARAIFRSPAPYVAILVCAVVLAPHVLWTVLNGFQTIDYAASKMHYPVIAVLTRGADSTAVVVAFHALMIVALWMAFAPVRRGLAARLWVSARMRRNWWILALALGPLVLTLLACVLQNVRISSQFMMPIFFMVPATILALSHLTVTHRRLQLLLVTVAGTAALALVAIAPANSLAKSGSTEAWREPTREVAIDATRLWHETFNRPVEIVSGDRRYSQAMSFYSVDAPSDFTEFDYRYAPWITPERIAQSGMVVLCATENAQCLETATRFETSGSRRFERVYRAKSEKSARRMTIVLIAPRNAAEPANEPD